MIAFLILCLILVLFGGLGFLLPFLWWVGVAALVLWAIGWLVGGAEAGYDRRRWYGH